jgi:hypothetical protein
MRTNPPRTRGQRVDQKRQPSFAESRLGRGQIESFIKSKPITLVNFGTSSSPVHPLIVDHFSRVCGDRFACAHVATEDLPYRTWFASRVRPEHEAQARLAGIGLFLDGQLAEFHPGYAPVRDLDLDFVVKVAHAFVGTLSDENAKAVTAAFDPIVCSYLARVAPSPPTKPVCDPYAVLGVETNAPREEVDAAWRRVRAENHSDKLQGMSEKLRKLADSESLGANLARDEIYASRGWG